jgi:hypothetical protein
VRNATIEPAPTGAARDPRNFAVPSGRVRYDLRLARGECVHVTYYILRKESGWCVQSRGFHWSFDSCQEASEFAVEMAGHYASASGRATQVRLQDADGTFHEIRCFGGVTRHPGVAALAAAVRHSPPRGP